MIAGALVPSQALGSRGNAGGPGFSAIETDWSRLRKTKRAEPGEIEFYCLS